MAPSFLGMSSAFRSVVMARAWARSGLAVLCSAHPPGLTTPRCLTTAG